MTMTAREIRDVLNLNGGAHEDWHDLAARIETTIDRKIRERADDLAVETRDGTTLLRVPLDLDAPDVRRLHATPAVGVWIQQRYGDGIIVEVDGSPPTAYLEVPRV
jgi:hypothetical protein